MSVTPDQAHAALNAAELAPDEMRHALAFLAGWTPDGLLAAVSTALRARKIRSITAPDIPPPRTETAS